MKALKKLIAAVAFILAIGTLSAQTSDPPDPNYGNDPTQGGNGPVGEAPISGGLGFFLGLAAAYGGRKTYKLCKK